MKISLFNFILITNLISAPSIEWVDKIRKLGNQTNHELVENTAEEAKNILTFTAMILVTIYEYPVKAKKLRLDYFRG